MSNSLWWWVAIGVTVCAFLLAAEWVVSSRRARPRPLSFVDETRSVAIGVENPSDFSGLEFAYRHGPYLHFIVHRNLTWSIWFYMAVYVPDRLSDLAELPSVMICVPQAASSFSGGPLINYSVKGEMDGQILGKYHSAIERLASTPKGLLYQIRPITVTVEAESGRTMARYEFRCHSEAPNTTSAGLGSTHFDLVYQPKHAELAGLVPGLGQLQPPTRVGSGRPTLLGIQYRPHWDDYHREDKVVLNADLLSPAPAERHVHVCKWFIRPDLPFSIQGTVTRTAKARLEALRGGLFIALAAGFVGALIALFVR
ncbi:Uncharacterised protein [Mycobacteroides abscessus subsp. bolletii]|uniref:hypothetical protein n=1 Tax=Mycobacteroides abscessus TaxID=36809 RepID=UPI0009CD08B3|nr:hypothetical protein [Mycobacteroides abscessus]SKG68393.1 Uncharacterised protein [Mycobacteroides abscessus subsp. bolletii]SLF40191.1 Uncharacterised protein [Mycobacteroides abscessus subsp. bolletii]